MTTHSLAYPASSGFSRLDAMGEKVSLPEHPAWRNHCSQGKSSLTGDIKCPWESGNAY